VKDQEYVVATVEDYRIAYDLLADTVRMIDSELNPRSRELLDAASRFVAAQKHEGKAGDALYFTRRNLAKILHWERYQIARVIEPLEVGGFFEMKKVGNAYHYQLAWKPEDEDEVPLLTPEELESEIAAHLDEIDPVYTDEAGDPSETTDL
jgi:hypothetical protein